MTRHRNSTLEAGSDSFLDIVANIVGILIILIVVAGLRVAQQPLHPDPTVTEKPASAPQFSIRQSLMERWQPAKDAVITIADAAIASARRRREERLAAEESARRAKALNEATALQNRIDELDRESKATEQLLTLGNADSEERQKSVQLVAEQQTQLLSHVRQLRTAVRSDQDQLNDRTEELRRNQETLASMQRQAISMANEQSELQRALTRARSRIEADVPETLEHIVTPISRSVEADEFHFRLSGARVSYIPLEALIERLEDRVRARSDIIVQQERYDGSVGPVDGFRLHFTAEMVESPLSMSRRSYTTVRLSVTSWQIVPVDSSVEESVAQASDPRSRFQSALQQIPHGATVTFWVYPDSFAAFRELRELARERGVRIAARPLPPGAPIAGSPRGSRSASQ